MRWRLTARIRSDVFCPDTDHAVARSKCVCRAVARSDDTGQAVDPQARWDAKVHAGWHRLRVVPPNVGGIARDPALAQRLMKRRLVDNAAASDNDEIGILAHAA